MVLSRTGTYLRWGLLGVLAVPAIVLGLSVLGHEVRMWSCPLKALTGIPCPTWGMTRSLVAITQLHPYQSLRYHLFGPAVFVLAPLFALQLINEIYARRPARLWVWLRQPAVWKPVLLAIATYHSWRLVQLWSTGTLQTNFHSSPLGHLVRSMF